MILQLLFSWAVVAFGQPQFHPLIALVASLCGYVPLFLVLDREKSAKRRFWIGFFWYAAVQAVQLFWALGHLFWIIYLPFVLHVVLLGLQFGLFALLFAPRSLTSLRALFALAGFWTLSEWVRLFFFSGHPWNPAGLALAWGDLSSQFAAYGGVYALTFVVILTNLLLAAAWERKKSSWAVSAAALAAMPYLLGGAHLAWNRPAGDEPILTAALVQTGFPIEETLSFSGSEDYYNYILEEWRKIFRLLKPVASQKMNLVALPELTVPGGTYFLIYDFDEAADALKEIFGRDVEASFPSFDYPVAGVVAGKRKVNNAFFAYTLANYLNADLAIGLEAHEEGAAYTTLTLFRPGTPEIQRYEKQLLVPMGEYVPLGALRDFAASYGVVGSFEAGDCCKVLAGSGASYGPSVCYEEVVGSLMRHNRPLGADILVNITNDGWFPGYGLPRVHYEHARLRTVETGLPALRACNTGVTAALDSFGRPLAMLDESGSGVLTARVPLQKASTLYSHFGDGPIVLFSLFLVCLFPRKII